MISDIANEVECTFENINIVMIQDRHVKWLLDRTRQFNEILQQTVLTKLGFACQVTREIAMKIWQCCSISNLIKKNQKAQFVFASESLEQ